VKTRSYYEKLFSDYPDVLTVKQFRAMLGGMNEKLALQIIRDNLVNHFLIGRTFYIPKIYAIDYAMSEHYFEYSKRRKIYKKGKTT
jgi:hypothetical protein